MQSRRRFFCARVELVQLARAFLCPAGQPTAAHSITGTAGQPRPGAIPPQPPTEGAQSHATGQGYTNTGKPRHRPQSRPQAEKRETPGKAPDSPTEPRNAAGDTPIPPRREKPHRAAHSGAQKQAIHSPGQIPPETPINAPQSRPGRGCYPLYYPPPKRRTGAHRAAHRGQAAGGTETPGRASPQPPQPRHSTPGKNPGDFL